MAHAVTFPLVRENSKRKKSAFNVTIFTDSPLNRVWGTPKFRFT